MRVEQDEEDAEFVVSTAAVPLGIDSGLGCSLKAPGEEGAEGEAHGELVKKMLEAKKQLEGGSQLAGAAVKVEVVCDSLNYKSSIWNTLVTTLRVEDNCDNFMGKFQKCETISLQ